MSCTLRRIAIATGVALGLAAAPAGAATLYSQGFEAPALGVGFSAGSLPSDWSLFSNNGAYGMGQSASALPNPAGGQQYLSLSGTNTGVDVVLGDTIAADTTYTLSAAIGHVDSSYGASWSIQAWAGCVGCSFLGQINSGAVGGLEPALGAWVVNAYSFDSALTPGVVGQHLVVFLNNYLYGTSQYDNVTVTAVSDIPEPAAFALFGMAVAGLAVVRGRRNSFGFGRAVV